MTRVVGDFYFAFLSIWTPIAWECSSDAKWPLSVWFTIFRPYPCLWWVPWQSISMHRAYPNSSRVVKNMSIFSIRYQQYNFLSLCKFHQGFVNMKLRQETISDVRRANKSWECHSKWAAELFIILCQPSTRKSIHSENTWSIISWYWITFVLHIQRICHNISKDT